MLEKLPLRADYFLSSWISGSFFKPSAMTATTRRNPTMPSRPVISIGILATVCVAAVWGLTAFPTLEYFPDSQGYLDNSDIRTRGYPLLLGVIEKAGALDFLGWFQLVVLAIASAYLGIQVSAVTALPVGLLVVAGTLLNPEIAKYTRYVLPDGLFLASVLGLGGQTLSTLRRGLTYRRTVAIGAMVAISYLLRPVGIVWIVPLGVIAIHMVASGQLPYRRLMQNGMIGIGVFLAVSVLVTISSDAIKKRTPSEMEMLTLSLSGKMAFLSPDYEKPGFQQAKRIVDGDSVHARDVFWSLDDLHHQFLFALTRYDHVRFELREPLKEVIGSEINQSSEQALRRFVVFFIADDFGGYAYDVFMNFSAAWFIGELITSGELDSYRSAVSEAGGGDQLNGPTPRHTVVVWTARIFLVASCLCATGFILSFAYRLFRRKPNTGWSVWLAMIACFLHTYFLLISLLGASLARYLIIVQPLQLIIVLAFLWAVIQLVWKKRSVKLQGKT